MIPDRLFLFGEDVMGGVLDRLLQMPVGHSL
jgi:hypothetical protein